MRGAMKEKGLTIPLRIVAIVLFGATRICLAQNCSSPPNPIVAENCLRGNPSTDWDLGSSTGDPSIVGFTSDISYNVGQTVNFKINTNATSYTINIYRMGFYGGLGARLIAVIPPSANLPQTQPACLTDASSGLVDCGNWAVSASWPIPSSAVSGVYIAKLVRGDTGGASHVFFIVRNDTAKSDLLFQTSDTTWQAYNTYGGNSLYQGGSSAPGRNPTRAYKVSLNRPILYPDQGATWPSTSGFFNAEFPMVRWLEANGYNVSYFSGVDTDRNGSLIPTHKVFLSVGHDEYWSSNQRASVVAARNAGVNLAFFSGNEMFWKTRWENSIDGSNTAYRTLVCYKETLANAVIDPADPPTWTGTWRDPRFSPPGDGGRPENAVTGTIFMVNGPTDNMLAVPYAYSQLRFWRNTSIATMAPNTTATFAPRTLGREWDEDLDNGQRPAGLIDLSYATAAVNTLLLDYGSTYGAGTATHSFTLYKNTSGALVFSAGDIQYSWSLDINHWNSDPQDNPIPPVDPRIQQATVNLFADMGAQPGSLQSGLVAATKSTDTVGPTSTILSPANQSSVAVGAPIVITGTASDQGGVVAGIEVSVDGGVTWHPAMGTNNWSYTWTPSALGQFSISSRATDDSGNIESPHPTIQVTDTLGNGSGPYTLWPASATPSTFSTSGGAAELGVKFHSDVAGYIQGIRFFKNSSDTGTDTGQLWTESGTLLGQVVFTGETGSGWQQMKFSSPIPISANTTYIAAYHTTSGYFSYNLNYFTSAGVDNAPLHAPANGVDPNGVYVYSSTPAFPQSTYNATNYWVDVVFSQ